MVARTQANGNARKLSASQRRAAVERTWPQSPDALAAVRHLCGSSADGQSAFSERDASHGRPLQRNSSGVGAELDVEAGRKAARLAAKDLVTDERVNGSHPERAAVVAFRGPILSRELRPAALSSDGRKKSKLLGTFPVYRRL